MFSWLAFLMVGDLCCNPKQIECFYGAVIVAGGGVCVGLPEVVRVVLNFEYCHGVCPLVSPRRGGGLVVEFFK